MGVNLDHILDEDGFQCETPQVIPLLHQHDIECANGYYFQIGDIPGNGIGGLQQVSNCNECGKLCSDRSTCLSYECSPTELKCNLNNVANPTAGAYGDYNFCTKQICGSGYYAQIGDIPGAGAVATGQPVSHCDDRAKLCSDHADCLS